MVSRPFGYAPRVRGEAAPAAAGGLLRLNLLHDKGFQHIADLDIVELFHAGEDSMTLCSFTKELTDRFRSAGKIRLSETYSSALGSFLRFRGGRDIQFCEIVPSLMEDYQDYLRGCGLSMNTVSFYLRILRAVYNRAVNRGLTEMRSPFRTVSASSASLLSASFITA